MIILFVAYIVFILQCFRNINVGLATYFAIRFCIPPTTRVFGISFNTLCLATFILLYLFLHKGRLIKNVNELKYIGKNIVFLFVGIFVLGLFPTLVPFDYQFSHLLQFFITEFVPALLILSVVKDEKQYKQLLTIIGYAILFNCCYAILTFFIDANPLFDNLTSAEDAYLYEGFREEGRFGFERKAEGIYGRINGKIGCSLMTLCFFLFYYNKDFGSPLLKKLILIFALIANILTTQRSGFMGILLFLLIIISSKKQIKLNLKRYWFIIVGGAVCVFCMPNMQGFRDYITSVIYIFSDAKQGVIESGGSSVEMRIEQSLVVLDMVSDYFLQGLGYAFDQYRSVEESLGDSGLLGIESYVLKVLINTGLIGLILWINYFASLIAPTIRHLKKKENRYYFAFIISYIAVIVMTDIAGSFFAFMSFAALNMLDMKFSRDNKILLNV